jgi:hypothetical protein
VLLLEGRSGRDLGGDAAVDAVEDAGHADEEGGLERADVVDQLGGVTLFVFCIGFFVVVVVFVLFLCVFGVN